MKHLLTVVLTALSLIAFPPAALAQPGSVPDGEASATSAPSNAPDSEASVPGGFAAGSAAPASGAQPMVAYLSYSRALAAMPRYALVQRQLTLLREQYEAEQKRAAAEFNQKYEAFLEGRRDFPPTILRKRQSELQQLMAQAEAFGQQARQELSQAEDSLMAPLRQQLDKVLEDYGLQQGFAIIVNTDTNATCFLSPLLSTDISQQIEALVGKK